MCVGPIASALTNKYGCRTVCIAGCVLSCIAFVLSTFSKSIEFLWLAYGVLGGLSFGLIYLPSVVAVGFYFESRRSLATGLAVSGSGLGTFIFAPMVTLLGDTYAWQESFLILAVILLCCVLFAALMKPLTSVIVFTYFFHTTNYTMILIVVYICQFVRKRIDYQLVHSFEQLEIHLTKFSVLLPYRLSRWVVVTKSDHFPAKIFSTPDRFSVYVHINHIYLSIIIVILWYHCTRIRLKVSWFIACKSHILLYILIFYEQDCARKCWSNVMGNMLDLGLLKDPVFVLICASGFFSTAGFYVPLYYLIDMAKMNVCKRYSPTPSLHPEFLPIMCYPGNFWQRRIGPAICNWHNQHICAHIFRLRRWLSKGQFVDVVQYQPCFGSHCHCDHTILYDLRIIHDNGHIVRDCWW